MITLFGKPEPTLAERLKASVSKTKAALAEAVDNVFLGERKIDPSILKDLETALLSADLGVKPTREILDAVREKMDRNALSDAAQLKHEIKSHIIRILNAPVRPDVATGSGIATSQNGSGPRVIFIVGVNGAGKTTSIGKLANRLRQEGRSVVLCAADTFRAAAVEQLEIWAQRNGIEVIKQKSGADPAAVVYDAVAAAKARAADVVILDTAGRLHSKSNLMAELEKMKRTWFSMRRPDKTVLRRRANLLRPWRSPASSSPSLTAPRKAASWSPFRASWACPFVLSEPASRSTIWFLSTPKRTPIPSLTEPWTRTPFASCNMRWPWRAKVLAWLARIPWWAAS